MNLLQTRLGESSDFLLRRIVIGTEQKIELALLFNDTLVSDKKVSFLLNALLYEIQESDFSFNKEDVVLDLQRYIIPHGGVTDTNKVDVCLKNVLVGNTVLLIDGNETALIVSTKGWKDRGVPETSVQTVIRGSREGFSENIKTNISLIRRRLIDERLRVVKKKIGQVTHTSVVVMYLDGIADKGVVKEVHQRLDRIDADAILESGYIEDYIQDNAFTPFPSMINTERPDTVAANLLEGKVAILVNGSPDVLLVPVVFAQFYQATEDYYHHSFFGIIRFLRLIALFINLLAPALYIALTTFHQEMLPTPLMLSIASQREQIPFPTAVEAFMMEFTFEILREAGIRMPRAIGSAISIVGALVLGEAAVSAGLVSPAMVIVVSITAIASFTFPYYSMSNAIRLLRFLFMILASFVGMVGIFLGMVILSLHLCSIRSFGVPYMAPMAPFNLDDQKDILFRFPFWKMHNRPSFLTKRNSVREKTPFPNPLVQPTEEEK